MQSINKIIHNRVFNHSPFSIVSLAQDIILPFLCRSPVPIRFVDSSSSSLFPSESLLIKLLLLLLSFLGLSLFVVLFVIIVAVDGRWCFTPALTPPLQSFSAVTYPSWLISRIATGVNYSLRTPDTLLHTVTAAFVVSHLRAMNYFIPLNCSWTFDRHSLKEYSRN